MANQIGTEKSSLNERKMDHEISIAAIECDLEEAKQSYRFDLIGEKEKHSILKSLGLDKLQALQLKLKSQLSRLLEV